MDDILELQKKYERGEINEEELSKEEIKKLEQLYEKQIEEKKECLKIYKEKISKYLKNK